MRSANRACEREKLEDFSAARGDSEPKSASHAISYAKNFGRSRDAVIRVYDAAGNVIETHEHSSRSNVLRIANLSRSGRTVVSDRAIDRELVSGTCITK